MNPAKTMERFNIIVIGAGQAGLAVGYYLSQQGQDFVILDGQARVGDVWRKRWESLRLFTPAQYSNLPGLPFPAPGDYFPHKDEVADYLEAYAQHFSLPVRLNTWVKSVRREDGKYTITTPRQVYQSNHVVIATGAFQSPRIPEFAAELDPRIRQLHSSEYCNPDQLQAGAALVVGAANSGVQIATELADAGRQVWLSGRNTGKIPRRLLGKDIYWWLTRTLFKITVDSWLGRRLAARVRGGDSIFADIADALARSGAVRVPRTQGVKGGKPRLEDGRVLDVTYVVWCTGFKPDYSWISLPVFDNEGYPAQHRGVAKDAPGLYFVGLPALYRLNSSLLGALERTPNTLPHRYLPDKFKSCRRRKNLKSSLPVRFRARRAEGRPEEILLASMALFWESTLEHFSYSQDTPVQIVSPIRALLST